MNHATTTPEITILTLPVPDGPGGLQQQLWLTGRHLNYWRRGHSPPRYSGHYAVTRSITEGLARTKLPVNYNPLRTDEVAERVHVLASVQALRQMVRWKQKGIIRQLTCGPNIAVRSSDCNSILASLEIDAVVNHVEWACDFWAMDHPELRSRCLCWSAGVDVAFWKPIDNSQRSHILVFDKRREDQDPERVKPYITYLKESGWPVDILTRCGRQGYTSEEYRFLLHRAAMMVGFTVGSESQGIAWAEAWAADVPTLILQQTENVYQELRYRCNTAPFLTPSTGVFFDDFYDFQHQFEQWQQGRYAFHPRQWVLEHMSDEVCACNLYEKLINLAQYLPYQPAEERSR
ncbi:MAG: hypothetical protein LVT47_02640 [Cyanobacteria bacterium LVE1205-1]